MLSCLRIVRGPLAPPAVVMQALCALFLISCARISPAQAQTQCGSERYWDQDGLQCRNCSKCDGERDIGIETACSEFADTECDQCPERFIYSENDKGCILKCAICPGKKCKNNLQCVCNSCYSDTDSFCEYPLPVCDIMGPPVEETTPDVTPRADDSLPSWGIGVIAIGVVIAIIAFSSCFLLVGVFSSNRRGRADTIGSEESAHSTSGLVNIRSISRTSTGTQSSYVLSSPLFSKHSLDFLRQSPTVESSVKSSPSSSPYTPTRFPHKSSSSGYHSSGNSLQKFSLPPSKLSKGTVTSV